MMSSTIRNMASDGYVLDGFPRTVHQAKALDRSLAGGQGGIDIVINLRVDDDVVVERITGRRSCPACGAVYHVKNMPPKVEDCEICQSQQRPRYGKVVKTG
jgi:adenylate kinase